MKSVGEDWEGFQALVANSNLEDKDLILRVLSMYSDPAVREQEIRNMSAVYTTLAKDVLPGLRRARFIANVEFTNYSSEELLKLVDENIDVLDEEALLRAATLVKCENKVAIYKKAIEKYSSARAQYNLAVVYAKGGKDAEAKAEVAKCDANDADVKNLLGVLALRAGKLDEAAKYSAASATEAAKENAAVVDIYQGNYKAAAAKVSKGFVAALANTLTGNYAAAKAAITCDCPYSAYLKAVIAAREGDAAAVKANLEAAKKDEKLAKRAASDIEFAQYK